MRRVLLSFALLGSLLACAPRASIPAAERDRVGKELNGQRRFLRVAAYVSPFFGDLSKKLVSDQPGSELELLQTAGGALITPPAAERVLRPGTKVRIGEVEFPTGWLIAKRIVMTPRYHPWAYLEIENDPNTYVVVLPQTTASYEDVRLELERLLATDDPTAAFQALPQEQRDAILRKQPLEGMGPRAVEMAWGLPERKKIDRPASTEEWSWAGGKRRAFFQDDRLVRWQAPRS